MEGILHCSFKLRSRWNRLVPIVQCLWALAHQSISDLETYPFQFPKIGHITHMLWQSLISLLYIFVQVSRRQILVIVTDTSFKILDEFTIFYRTSNFQIGLTYTHIKKSFASRRFHKFRNLYIQMEQRSTQRTFQLFLLLMKTTYCMVYHNTDRLSEVVVQIAIHTSTSNTQQHVLLH